MAGAGGAARRASLLLRAARTDGCRARHDRPLAGFSGAFRGFRRRLGAPCRRQTSSRSGFRKSGRAYEVAAHVSILDTLRQHGHVLASSCESGTCGTCRCRFTDGEPDHRDLVLSDDEKKTRHHDLRLAREIADTDAGSLRMTNVTAHLLIPPPRNAWGGCIGDLRSPFLRNKNADALHRLCAKRRSGGGSSPIERYGTLRMILPPPRRSLIARHSRSLVSAFPKDGRRRRPTPPHYSLRSWGRDKKSLPCRETK